MFTKVHKGLAWMICLSILIMLFPAGALATTGETGGTTPAMTEIRVAFTDGATAESTGSSLTCAQNQVVQTIKVEMNEAVTLATDPVVMMVGASGDCADHITSSVEYGTIALDTEDSTGKTLVITPDGSNAIAGYLGTMTFTVPSGTIVGLDSDTTFTLHVVAPVVTAVNGGVSPASGTSIEGTKTFTFSFASTYSTLKELELDIYMGSGNVSTNRNYNNAVSVNLPANEAALETLIVNTNNAFKASSRSTLVSSYGENGIRLFEAAGFRAGQDMADTVEDNIAYDSDTGTWTLTLDTYMLKTDALEFLVAAKDNAGGKWGENNYSLNSGADTKAFDYTLTNTGKPALEDLTVKFSDGTSASGTSAITCAQNKVVSSIVVSMNEPVTVSSADVNMVGTKGDCETNIPSSVKYGTLASDPNDSTKLIITPDPGNGIAGYLGEMTFSVAQGVIKDAIEDGTDHVNDAASFTLTVTGTATLVSDNGYGIHDGKVYASYKLKDASGSQITLDSGNVSSMSVTYDGATTSLTPDTDPLLWFNVERDTGDYSYTVVTTAGNTYIAPFTWAGTTAASFSATGNKGEHDGTTYMEFALKHGNSSISLSSDANVVLIAEKAPDGLWTALDANTDATLWFNVAHTCGAYQFIVVTSDYTIYTATLDWEQLAVTAVKLPAANVNQSDGNTTASKANQNAVTVSKSGNTVTVSGRISTLQYFTSTTSGQGSHQWIGLDIGTGESSLAGITYTSNGSSHAFDSTDITEASSVGLDAGHFILWIKADEVVSTSKVFTLSENGKADTTITVVFSKVSSGSSNSGTTSATYTISASAGTGGSITPTVATVTSGGSKTFTITAKDGYSIKDVLVDGASVGAVSSYTFTNVTDDHTIKAVFTNGWVSPYTDVSDGDWFYSAVEYAVGAGLMNGTTTDAFEPDSSTTRGMIVTILYRLAGSPAVTGDSGLTDIESGLWYADAVAWATANGIVTGYDNGAFGPNDTMTREQVAAILYRYAVYKGYDTDASGDLSAYTDASDVSSWALAGMKWAVSEGLINGMGDNTLNPSGTLTRAQIATLLMRFCENIAK